MFNSEGLWKSGEHLVKALWMFERLIQNSKKLIYRELATNFSSCVKTFIIYDFLRLLKPEAWKPKPETWNLKLRS